MLAYQITEYIPDENSRSGWKYCKKYTLKNFSLDGLNIKSIGSLYWEGVNRSRTKYYLIQYMPEHELNTMTNQKTFQQASKDNAADMRARIKARDLQRQQARQAKQQQRQQEQDQ